MNTAFPLCSVRPSFIIPIRFDVHAIVVPAFQSVETHLNPISILDGDRYAGIVGP